MCERKETEQKEQTQSPTCVTHLGFGFNSIDTMFFAIDLNGEFFMLFSVVAFLSPWLIGQKIPMRALQSLMESVFEQEH